ncbi:adenylate kinase [Actinoplanes sp. NPDC024001]|uniref:adenylate kinase n=1 Tax=Actinoplanes sp. NPDC024001 TaxID=3154598 RepID=UPI0033E4029B
MPAPTGKRILVYGVTGSGKSTLAARIGARLGLPYHSVDDLTWEPGWVQVPVEEQRRRMTEVCAGDTWVIDAAYGSWTDIPLARADLVIGLDYPRWVSLSRLIRRTVARWITRTPICNGNVESLRTLFGKDGLVAFHFQSFPRKRRRMRQWQTDPELPPVLLFRSPADAERWLRAVISPS